MPARHEWALLRLPMLHKKRAACPGNGGQRQLGGSRRSCWQLRGSRQPFSCLGTKGRSARPSWQSEKTGLAFFRSGEEANPWLAGDSPARREAAFGRKLCSFYGWTAPKKKRRRHWRNLGRRKMGCRFCRKMENGCKNTFYAKCRRRSAAFCMC